MNIFITGASGFIGGSIAAGLVRAGHRVTGCDLALFKGCEWEPLEQPDVELIKDIGAITERELDGAARWRRNVRGDGDRPSQALPAALRALRTHVMK